MADTTETPTAEPEPYQDTPPNVLIPRGGGERFLLILACAMIVLAGLRNVSGVLEPIILAALLSSACLRPVRILTSWGIPRAIAIGLILLLAGSLLAATSIYAGSALAEFRASHVFEQASERIHKFFEDQFQATKDPLLTKRMEELIIQIGASLMSGISNFFVVLLLMFFMLFEVQHLPKKLGHAFRLPADDLGIYSVAAQKIHDYITLKTFTSLLTGLLVYVLCMLMGLGFAPLWALIAFLFNFVPNIGSIIAGIPVVALALVQPEAGSAIVFDWMSAGIAAIGIGLINLWVGNILEPKMMGKRLGLSSLVVFASLMLWGWVLGPIGMLAAVPLTVILKMLLEHSDDMRWAAALLGDDDGTDTVASVVRVAPSTAPSTAPDDRDDERADDRQRSERESRRE